MRNNSLLIDLIVGFLCLITVSLLWAYPIILLIVIILIAAIYLLLIKEKSEFYLFIICAVSGAAAEVIAIAFGAWTYALPNILGIPLWLIPLWGTAAVFIKRLYFTIAGNKK